MGMEKCLRIWESVSVEEIACVKEREEVLGCGRCLRKGDEMERCLGDAML